MKKENIKYIGLICSMILMNIISCIYMKNNLNKKELTFQCVDISKEKEEISGVVYLSIEDNKKSVVIVDAISVKDNEKSEMFGTGVALCETDGSVYVCTSYHIIEEADSIYITTYSGEKKLCNVVKSDRNRDIAILESHMEPLNDVYIATIGNSDYEKEGAEVRIIGNALGNGLSITSGIISNRTDVYYEDIEMFQVDAAINTGCSGGGLFNMSGELIGIVKSRVNDGYSQNIGFVIPINEVMSLFTQIE